LCHFPRDCPPSLRLPITPCAVPLPDLIGLRTLFPLSFSPPSSLPCPAPRLFRAHAFVLFHQALFFFFVVVQETLQIWLILIFISSQGRWPFFFPQVKNTPFRGRPCRHTLFFPDSFSVSSQDLIPSFFEYSLLIFVLERPRHSGMSFPPVQLFFPYTGSFHLFSQRELPASFLTTLIFSLNAEQLFLTLFLCEGPAPTSALVIPVPSPPWGFPSL